jgi:hypothetical protein
MMDFLEAVVIPGATAPSIHNEGEARFTFKVRSTSKKICDFWLFSDWTQILLHPAWFMQTISATLESGSAHITCRLFQHSICCDAFWANKTLQRTPSRIASLFLDRLLFLSTVAPEFGRVHRGSLSLAFGHN